MTHQTKGGLAAIIVFAAVAVSAGANPIVELNDQRLATSVPPLVLNGRTLVPMRDIFQALGATVNYNALTRGITATRDASTVNLQIGNKSATVNGQTVQLEQAPMVISGSTLVPLRFVSEAMGARVTYNGPAELVSIYPSTGSGTQVAGMRTISVPSGAVVPVNLDTDMSSATAKVGDKFTATVRSANPGDSEFPAGTKLEGVVTEAAAKNGDNPGALALDFRAAILPSGSRVPLQGSLTSLDSDSVNQTRGRIIAKPGSGKDNTGRNVLIGAGGGFLLGKVIGRSSTTTGVLGGLAGYLLSRKDKKKASDATIAAGTELGVRIDRDVSYSDETYAESRAQYLKL